MSIIKKTREDMGLTQKSLAQLSGISLRTIQRLESNNNIPKGHTLIELSKAFEMTALEFKNMFVTKEDVDQSDAANIRIINLSVLSFLGIPFGNVILPIILWRKYRNSLFVDDVAKRIINIQIIFSILLALFLCISPFISKTYFPDIPLILYVLLFAYIVNIVIVLKTAIKIGQNDYDVLETSLRFI